MLKSDLTPRLPVVAAQIASSELSEMENLKECV
jgi:hypothetical protein